MEGNNILHEINDEKFTCNGSVPVAVVAKVYGKHTCWVRAGLVCGWLPIGFATRKGKRLTSLNEMQNKYGRINYYISPQLLYKETGFKWKGEKTL